METRPSDTHIQASEPPRDIDKAEDTKISRGFWRYVIIGYAIGMAIGAVIFVFLLIAMQNMKLGIPIVFVVAALAQIGTGGGLVGAGIYISKLTDRGDDDDDEDGPGGGNKAVVIASEPSRSPRPAFKPKLARAPA